jgi:hypothetical protein
LCPGSVSAEEGGRFTERGAAFGSLPGLRYAGVVKVSDVMDRLREDGWFLVVTKGVTDSLNMWRNPAV